MTPLRVVALAHEPAGPSARYRLAQFAGPLAAAGVALSVLPLPRSTRHRLAAFASLPPHDLVVLSRVLLGSGEVKRLRRAARRIVFDVDDALPFRPAHDGGGRSSRRSARFRRLCGAADLVVAGNGYLAELATPVAKAVAIVPTAVDLTRYPATPAEAPGPVLVWIGQPATAPYLHALAPALAVVAARRPDARLHVIGAELPRVTGLAVDHREWAEATEVAELRQGQVALAPLPDDPWTRGKCALRLLQYLAAGVPAVASPVGVQGEILAAAAVACPAGPVAAWPEAILDLLGDPARRARLAAEGRAFVESRFSVPAVLPALVAAWRQAAG